MYTKRLLVSALLLVCGAIPASATLVNYSTLSAFTAGNSDQTFQNITFPSGSEGTTFTDSTTGVVFSDITGLFGVATPAGWPVGSTLQANQCSSSGGCTLTITLPSAVTSVSLFAGLSGFNAFQVTISNGVDAPFSTNQEQSNLQTPLFYGFRSDSPFTMFTISTEDNVNSLFIDSMEVGTPTGDAGPPPDTPEVATLLMIGSGLVMLRCGRRWIPRV
jgi:hypothetical protein